jgi:catechol 2,3-dioxygenase-like lactoylglutathione lyase family enzyme
MADFLHTMVRITDPERSRAFYEALGFRFSRDIDIVRDAELEATNYFFSIGDADNTVRDGGNRLCFVNDPDRKLTIAN